ncbi:glycosyltransferase [Methylobacterium gossipiicola]|uniref:Glycosyltransferase involved in cell wall bisynthesis n=1 Tax=Methylobacterium gossipiicola TaxID=582675 RepID=A0A1I2RWU0_9HYPH|nr:glycosyltransferase [Methylobacterium gossipiicola]SFG42221.1 Glycosyltransferase involved in cell wall bisynthesis [Methylobacterium gossipiicola]
MTRPTVLVIAPMPAFPTSAGNRRRLVATCDALARGGFAVDLAYFAHEDQIYRRFGQHPPTDAAAMAGAFQRTFRIEPRAAIPLKTRARHFGLDDWCPDEVVEFVAWYGATYPKTRIVLVNYVFLSRCLAAVPPGTLTLIDTHDRFADRQAQYRPFRAEPNFFYTDTRSEAEGLDRADIVLAIQAEEARYFESLTRARVHLLPPHFPSRRPFRAPGRLARIGFLGHGNDPNLFSIGRFIEVWSADWTPDRPTLVVAGEICTGLGATPRPGVERAGYVACLEDFYDRVDLVVAPMLMGSGLKMKVAEALCFGLPVVGTRIGFEGFSPVARAHRCETVAEVKAMLLEMSGDAHGLAALTEVCADLFAGYNEVTRSAETSLLALLREHVGADLAGESQASPDIREEPVRTTILPGGRLTRVTGLVSSERDSPEHGLLVATARNPPPGSGPYAPERRRWFARAGTDMGSAGDGGVIDAEIVLSPEWVRGRTLPPALRATLAREIVGAVPDWEARASLVGGGSGHITLALALPSHLVTGRHPGAAFLLGPETVTEVTLGTATPLSLTQALPFVSRTRTDLAPVPASLTLDGADVPADDCVLLVLHDDLIGRVALPLGPRA